MKSFDYLLTSQSIVSLKYNDTLCSILYKWRYFFFFIKNKTKVAWFLDFPLYEKKVTWVQRKDQKTRNKNFMKKVTVIHWYLENSNFSVGILKIERFLYSRKRKMQCLLLPELDSVSWFRYGKSQLFPTICNSFDKHNIQFWG